ncbi:hypothetical protein V2J09_002699 [Rumex salicifolius]
MAKTNFNTILTLVILQLFSPTLNAARTPIHGDVAGSSVIDITKYGARPGGDIVGALSKAWNKACVSPAANNKVVIPKGDYLMGPITLKGPCKGPIQLEVAGNIKASADPADFDGRDALLTINYVDRLTVAGVLGGGNFRFNFITNSVITGISSINSKSFHINIIGCKNLTLTKMNIYAEPESINTDGIHIGKSEGVTITDVDINTGDDCVSIGDGTKQFTVEKVTCGRGHGLSIGSLGKFGNEEAVSGVYFKNCTVKNADNGVRIKTWLNSFPAVAEELHFEDIVVQNVTNPIIVDQAYCPYGHCDRKAVKLSKISFKNIRGSGSSPTSIKLVCSSQVRCEPIELANIDLTYNGKEGVSECANVKPRLTGKINPPACTKLAPEAAIA